MHTVLLVVHLLVTIALIAVVLIQKSEGGGLGMGGGGGGGGGFMTGRATANLLTRTTAILATLFITLSLVIAWYNQPEKAAGSILDSVPAISEPASNGAPTEPATPAAPSAPVAQ